MPTPVAHVVVGLPVAGPFDYAVPPDLRERIRVGQRVYVPFRAKPCVGYVVGLARRSSFSQLKPVLTILDETPLLSEQFLKFTRAFAAYYACSWGEAIETALPAALRSKKQTALNVALTPPQEKPMAGVTLLQGFLAQAASFLVEKIQKTLAAGQGVIILVPEIRQMEEVRKLLANHSLGPYAAFDHSLTAGRELQEWCDVRQGKTRVVVATRSGVFVPMPSLGLVIMIDEENAAYKQEPSPFYHARETSFLRQEFEPFELVFVTPAPSAELWRTLKLRKAQVITPAPETAAPLQPLDLTNYKSGGQMLISFPLQNFIRETMARKGRVLLFLNRRGFSMMTRCNQCGFVLKCSRCQVNLTYLYSQRKMVCRRCSAKSDLPKVCPQCQSAYLRSMGTGTEKLESELSRIYPQAKIGMFDREARDIPQEAEIVIATQAIVPVLNPGMFSLAAVLDFEAEINRVDFRSGARVYSLLTRLRQAVKDKLVVQTRDPKYYAISALSKGEPERFYARELKLRKDLGLPPYLHLVALSMRGMDESVVFAQCQALYAELVKLAPDHFDVLDPEPDITPKLRDQFRFTIMLKGKSVTRILKTIEPLVRDFKKRKGVILTVNVDP